MTDLYITITDENHEVLKMLEIYEDGSDSEACEKITKVLGEEFESLSEIFL